MNEKLDNFSVVKKK